MDLIACYVGKVMMNYKERKVDSLYCVSIEFWTLKC